MSFFYIQCSHRGRVVLVFCKTIFPDPFHYTPFIPQEIWTLTNRPIHISTFYIQYIQINTWAFPYWPGYHPETPILARDGVEGCMTNMTGSKLSICSHPGKITVFGLLQDHFHIEAHIGLDFVLDQYRCLFSRCRKYVINSLIHGHFHTDQSDFLLKRTAYCSPPVDFLYNLQFSS
jgi:hypothetical protein